MVDASNLSKLEKLLVLTSAGNDNKFESLAKAMMDHHALIHLDEKGEKKPWKHPHKGRGWKSRERRERERKAYMAAHRDVDSDKDKVDVPAWGDKTTMMKVRARCQKLDVTLLKGTRMNQIPSPKVQKK